MFTGIITDIGIIAALDQQGDLRARITTGYDTAASTWVPQLHRTAYA